MAKARTIDEVVARLQALAAELKPDDGVRWFNRLYLEVTLGVREFVRTPGNLEAPPFLEDLDVYFGNAYFAALDAANAGRAPAHAWAPLFEARHSRDIAPLQFALAGMNAHINHDLPVAVVNTSRDLSTTPTAGSHPADYAYINSVLASVEPAVRALFEDDVLRALDQAAPGLQDVVANFNLVAGRKAAWVNAQTLWALRQDAPGLADEYLAGLDRLVGFAGRGLLVPLLGLPSPPP
jgi:hypothetical protein